MAETQRRDSSEGGALSASVVRDPVRGMAVDPAAGVLYPVFGLILSPIIAAVAMALSSVSVVGNALRLRTARL